MKKLGKHNLPEDLTFKPGSHIDHDLTVIDHLGGTRKVDVYLCRSKRLKRLVACKIILPGTIENNTVRDALIKEGEILQQLRHPNIIEGYGLYFEPRPSIVMEYLEGQNIKTTFFEGNYEAFDIRDFIEVVLQLSDALSYVHGQGFLHLDVKPSNIFYYEGHVKLMDFGLARKFSPNKPLQHKSGTVKYMAPEQYFKRPLAYATDVFGMGVTFYQLLTGGKLPYETIEQLDKDGKLRRQSDYHSPVQLPSQVNPSVNNSLDMIVLRAIHPDINERIQTPAAFKAALLDTL